MSDGPETGSCGWDILVRVTHWGTASAVLLNATLLADAGAAHITLGYVAATCVLVRLIWGILGPRPARLSRFWPSLSKTRAHIAALKAGSHPRYASHNPLGAWMIFAFWGAIAGLFGTGIWGMDRFEDLHEALGVLVLFLALVHLGGVVFARLVGDRDVMVRMIRGRGRD